MDAPLSRSPSLLFSARVSLFCSCQLCCRVACLHGSLRSLGAHFSTCPQRSSDIAPKLPKAVNEAGDWTGRGQVCVVFAPLSPRVRLPPSLSPPSLVLLPLVVLLAVRVPVRCTSRILCWVTAGLPESAELTSLSPHVLEDEPDGVAPLHRPRCCAVLGAVQARVCCFAMPTSHHSSGRAGFPVDARMCRLRMAIGRPRSSTASAAFGRTTALLLIPFLSKAKCVCV